KGWDARKRAYCLKIQPATGSFARNLIYSTKPVKTLEELPEEITPYRLMFWGSILSLQYHKNNNNGLQTIIEFMKAH
ncbi:hypothetical protein, partial [Pantoea brenneri]